MLIRAIFDFVLLSVTLPALRKPGLGRNVKFKAGLIFDMKISFVRRSIESYFFIYTKNS